MRKRLPQKRFQLSLFLLTILLLGYSLQADAQTSWSTVRIGGGGSVTSIKAHPKVPNLFFATTDVGNPYRWNHNAQKWEGLLNWVPLSQQNNSACGNIAFDPQDATGNILYATVGKMADYANGWSPPGKVIKSTDRGTTWTDAGLTIRVAANSAQDKRGGDRIVVDPQNSSVVYVTSHADGTYKGVNSGTSWSKVNALNGRFIAFDVSGGMISGVTKNIFIGCHDGVYLSTDGGETFTLMPGSPSEVRRAAIHPNGTMYVTAGIRESGTDTDYTNSGVFKWNGSSWSKFTPQASADYIGVDVNPHNSEEVIVNVHSWDSPTFRSKDGGLIWDRFARSFDVSEMPFKTSDHFAKNITDFVFDPFNAGHVWFTDIFAVYQTTDVWASTVQWKGRVVDLEEFVTMGTILCPPAGSPNKLLTGGADLGGFDHKSITEPPTKSMAAFFPWTPEGLSGNMVGVAVQETNPNFIARVGRKGWGGSAYGGYSTNGGDNYTIFSTYPPGTSGGRIVVSAKSETMIWVGQGGSAYRSTNRGGSWTAVSGLPTGLVPGSNIFDGGSPNPIAADKVNGDKFYAYQNGKFYVSTDGGASFSIASSTLPVLTSISFLKVETVPDKEGHIWVSLQAAGLWYSDNSGASFTKIANVQDARLMSVGKALSTEPAVYVMGTVNNIKDGVFRSNDNGASWTQIDNASYKMGNEPNSMAADRVVYGRVFIGTNGNGIFVGSGPAPVAPANLTASASGPNQINLSWTDNTSNETHFKIERKEGPGNFMFLSNAPANSTSFSDTDLIPGTSYSYRVSSDGISGSSDWSNVASATTTGIAPAKLVITGSTAGFQTSGKEFSYDNNTATRWSGSGVLSNTWITYDLGADKTVNYLKLMIFSGNSRTNPIKVEMGNGSTWTQVWSGNTALTAGYQTINVADNTNRYVRISLTGANSEGTYWFHITETEIYGTESAAPTNLKASASGSNGVNLSWTDVSDDETSFRIERKEGTGNYVFLSNAPANATSFSENGLLPGTTYSYRIRSDGSNGSSAWSDEASVTTLGTPPVKLVITGSTAGYNDATNPKENSYDGNTGTRWSGNGTLSSTWVTYDLGADKAVNYLKLMMFSGSTRTNPIKVEMGNGSSWTQVWSGNTALTAGFQTIDIADNTNRYVRISLTGANSEGAYWFGITETEIYGTDPTAPAYLKASASGFNGINLSWTDNSNDETSFRIERKEGTGNYVFLSNAPANATSFSDTGLQQSTTYTYRVRSERSNGSSAWSNEASATTLGPVKLIITGSTAGFSDATNPKEHSYDGNTTTRWSGSGAVSSTWIIYDLGSYKTVNYLKLMLFSGNTRTNPIKVEMGDGSTWTQVWSGNTALTAGFQTLDIADNTNRYVKISLTGANSEGTYWFHLNETEIYGTEPDGPATIKLEEANYIYDGKPRAVSGYAYGIGGIEDKLSPALSFTYKDTIGNVINGAPVNVGTYIVEASYAGNTSYKPVSAKATFRISPKALAVTASNQTKECGVAINLGTTDFTVAGLVAADKVNTVLLTSESAAESGSKGTYAIVAANAQGSGLSNYQISYVNGTLTISDATKPVPDIAELPQVNGECSVTVTAPTATDACAGKLTASTNHPLTYNQQGTYTITWTFDDGNGNTTTQNQSVVVKDVSAPEITHRPEVPVQCYSADGTYTIPSLTATDNCGTTTISYSISGATTRSGSGADASGQFNTGVSTIEWLVEDGHGNETRTETNVVINSAVTVSIPDVYAMDPNVDEKNTLYLGYGPSSLTINALPSGGTGPYTYLWNDVAGASSLSVNSAGVYTVKVVDALGCSTTASITIKVEDVRCGNNNDKVKVCHNGKEICISRNAVQEHLNHGDRLGTCGVGLASNSKDADESVATVSNLREIETANSNVVSVYPNPVESVLQVSVSSLKPGATMQLYNLTGTLLLSLPLEKSTESISMQGFTPGLYLLTVKNGDGVTTKKILKQ
ncbi:fibronectin type III domain-containing protein [Paradesertivirga mongoliensis]|uniref:Fibronectin type III domain-containing protein n=1 Tax=Paradesertivirga mongoliensis TaxID=2100740 RepID=A0ABW4ZKB2_9SPHI|nr:fibronectin type III domain-containing protein [Pedobacter mongoliensis]